MRKIQTGEEFASFIYGLHRSETLYQEMNCLVASIADRDSAIAAQAAEAKRQEVVKAINNMEPVMYISPYVNGFREALAELKCSPSLQPADAPVPKEALELAGDVINHLGLRRS